MSKYDYSEIEQQVNTVLAHQDKELREINRPDHSEIDSRISESEELFKSPEYGDRLVSLKTSGKQLPVEQPHKVMVVPSWENLCKEAMPLMFFHS